jgi:hypothetical protein
MNDKKENKEVLKTLDKVIGSLENTSVKLDTIVTQSQIDNLERNILSIEEIIKELKKETCSAENKVNRTKNSIERELSGFRAIAISSFVLGMFNLFGFILISTYIK